MAAIWVHWVPIWSAVARAPTASNRPVPTRSGWLIIHSSARAPPIDPPSTTATSVMPSAASAATSASTWSRTDISGNLEPQGFPSDAVELGPVEPRQPPSTLVATAHQRLVSIGAAGAATPSHQPGVGCPGPAGPVMWESPVRACNTTTTLSRVGDSSPQRCTAIETSSMTAPLSVVIEPMSTRPTSPSAGSVCVGTSKIVMSKSSEGRHGLRVATGISGRTEFPCRGEAELEVGQDVVDALDADGQPHQTGGDAGGQLLGGAQLRVGGRCRVNHQRAHVADVGDVAVQLQRVHERLPSLDATGQLERQHGAGSLGRQLLC